jgi:hypothetical protein
MSTNQETETETEKKEKQKKANAENRDRYVSVRAREKSQIVHSKSPPRNPISSSPPSAPAFSLCLHPHFPHHLGVLVVSRRVVVSGGGDGGRVK